MERRAGVSVLIVVAVVSTAVILALPQVQLPTQEVPTDDTKAVLDHFNMLDWWDVAWELANKTDYVSFLQAILSYGSRYDGTPGYTLAANWIIDRLQSWSIISFYVGMHDSVLGYQKGYGNDSRAIVFGAHLDSAQGYLGVDQNAGGCAVVVTIAMILSQFRLPVDVYYCFFAGNMQFLDAQNKNRALWGSREISQYLVSQGANVTAFYNFDELLYYDRVRDASRRVLAEYDTQLGLGYHPTKYLADLMIAFMKHSGLSITSESGGMPAQTDHIPFLAAGFPSINVRSGHTYSIDDPPTDMMNEPRFNTTQAFLVARASASLAVYLSTRGNGDISRQRIQRVMSPLSYARMEAVITIPQVLHVRGTTSNGSRLAAAINTDTLVVLPTTVLPIGNFSLTSNLTSPLGPLTVTVSNLMNSTSTITLYLEYVSDTDGNGILDSEQYVWPRPSPPLDWDSDGLSDIDEVGNGTDVFAPDTDRDGMGDAFEVQYGLDSLHDDSREDPDKDGLPSNREMQLGTNPMNNDTDVDGMPDGWEVKWGTKPLVNDAALDPENDTLTNIQECRYGSDPFSPDGDHDGVPDVIEVQLGMNPLSPDSDKDRLRDQLELLEHLNPLGPDFDYDFLLDGFDSNPLINNILVVVMMTLVPLAIGSILLRRRIR